MSKWVLENLEIVLGVLSFAVIAVAAYVFTDSDTDVWFVVAITSIASGLVNGVVFWMIRRRQRTIRAAVMEDIRTMLKDNVTNSLAVISLNSQLARELEPKRRDRILEAVEQIDTLLDNLSDESLRSWRAYYEDTSLQNVPDK